MTRIAKFSYRIM